MNDDETIKAAMTELASLSRVDHKLALTEAMNLERVLNVLLPRLLSRIGSNQLNLAQTSNVEELQSVYKKIHEKLIGMISHIMKRVRDDKNCKLPCHAILHLLLSNDSNEMTYNQSINPFTLNLALAFLTLGLPRTSIEEAELLLPGMLVVLGAHSGIVSVSSPSRKLQSSQVVHILLRILERFVSEDLHTSQELSFTSKAVCDSQNVSKLSRSGTFDNVRMLLSNNVTICQSTSELFLDVLLYRFSASLTMPPPGLSEAGHERLRTGSSLVAKDWAAEMAGPGRLRDLKLALLDILAPTRRWSLFLNTGYKKGVSFTVILLVVATGDSDAEVAQRAQFYLKLLLDSTKAEGSEIDGSAALGNSFTVIVSTLTLVLGELNSDSILSKVTSIRSEINESSASTKERSAISLKRRMVSDKTAAATISFCSKIFEESPYLLLQLSEALAIGHLSISTASMLLAPYSSSLSMTQANSCLAAARMLNALCTRLVATPAVLKSDEILSILSSALSTSCTILSGVSAYKQSSSTGLSSIEGSVAVRDACYGIICSLSRCREFCVQGRIFGANEPSARSIETANLLFGCAAYEVENLRPRTVAALDALLEAYCREIPIDRSKKTSFELLKDSDNPWLHKPTSSLSANSAYNQEESLSSALLPLLWSAAQPSRSKASRSAAVSWAGKLLQSADSTNGSHLLCFLAGDSDVTTSSIAREALGLHRSIGDTSIVQSDIAVPNFSSISQILFSEGCDSLKSVRPQFHDFSQTGQAATVRFALNSFLNDLYNTDEEAIKLYMRALCHTLISWGSEGKGKEAQNSPDGLDLLDECASCLSSCISSSKISRQLIIKEEISISIDALRRLAICSESSKARRYLAASVGYLYEDFELWKHDRSEPLFYAYLTSSGLRTSLERCSQSLSEVKDIRVLSGEVHGAAYLGAWSIRALRLWVAMQSLEDVNEDVKQCLEHASQVLISLGNGIALNDQVFVHAFSQALEIALSFDSFDAPILNPILYLGVSASLSSLYNAIKVSFAGSANEPVKVRALIQCAGVALASSTSASGQISVAIGPLRLLCLDSIFSAFESSAYRQDPEIAIVAGEALAAYADSFSPENVAWNIDSLPWPSEFNNERFKLMPPHEQVLFGLLFRDMKSSNKQSRSAVGPALLALVARAAREVSIDIRHLNRHFITTVVNHLPEIQSAFITLLSDPKSKQLVRESCCLGLTACQGLADASSRSSLHVKGLEISLKDSLHESLLKAFGQSKTYSKSAMIESQAQHTERISNERRDTNRVEPEESIQVEQPENGGAIGVGEAALGAYTVMAAAAAAIGRSDILYSLLFLSVSHPFWFSGEARDRYCASVLLGESCILKDTKSMIEMRIALRPHLSTLIPRLLRAKHDPNKQTREQIEILWLGITGGGAEARQNITENLLPTIDCLLNDTRSKLWKARVGACGALAEIIVGRSWCALGGGDAFLEEDDALIPLRSSEVTAAVRLIRLWKAAIRAMDDVREAVRESGETLARTLKTLTVRLCDPTSEIQALNARNDNVENNDRLQSSARAASFTSLPFFLKFGLNQQCAEAAGVCISCLTGIVEIASPSTLKPVIPDLIGSLLTAMSSLEPAALNYFQVRAAGRESSETYDQLEQARIQLVQRGPLTLALNRCLEMVPRLDITTQQLIIPQLDSALRCSAGFATRAATADSVALLSQSCPTAFRFAGFSSINPSVRLLRALYNASEKERGTGAKDKMSHALGKLAAQCPGQAVRSLVLRIADRYNMSTGNYDDPLARKAAAAAVHAIVFKASNQVLDGGSNDIWRRKIFPIAFLGRKDADPKISLLWNDIWEEGRSLLVSENGVDTGVQIEERLLPWLTKECVKALQDFSWIRRVAGAASLSELCDLYILSPTLNQNSFIPVDGQRLRRRAESAKLGLISCVATLIKPRLWSGKTELLKATVNIAHKWISYDDNFSNDQQCFCVPIMTVAKSSCFDLFHGDNYFKTKFFSDFVDEDLNYLEHDISEEQSTRTSSSVIDCDEDYVIDDEIKQEESTTLSYSGLCVALVYAALPPSQGKTFDFSHDEILPFKAAALEGAAKLIRARRETLKINENLHDLYIALSPRLIQVIGSNPLLASTNTGSTNIPPLMVARSIQCLSSLFWKGFGKADDSVQDVHTVFLLFRSIGGTKQGAWTVREAALDGASEMITHCSIHFLENHRFLSDIISFASEAQNDKKFWRVRAAGLSLLKSLVLRSSSGSQRFSGTSISEPSFKIQCPSFILEAVLPFKEDIMTLARRALMDSQAEVTSIASDICKSISWWL